jgi:sodium/pantothenate symporter
MASTKNTFKMATQQMVWTTGVLVAAYMAAILYFVVRGARQTRQMSDYALGSVSFSPWLVGLSLAAASTSAATFIINPGFIALYGWSAFLAFAVFLPLGKYLSLVLLTKGFRQQGKAGNVLSMGQWMGTKFQSKPFAVFFAVLSLLLVTFMVLICVGMTKVLAQALNLGETTALAGIVLFVFGYMMFGGANSMVYTNTIQAFFKLVVAVLLLVSGYRYLSAGIDQFWAQIAAIDPLLTANVHPQSPLFRDWFEIMFCPFVVGIAVVCQPHIITKSLMLKEEKEVNTYLLAGIAAEIIFFSVVFVGFYARLSFPDLSSGGTALKMDGIIPAYVVKEFSVWAALVVVLGLLSSGLATLEGLILSLSTTLTNDILGVFRPSSQRHLMAFNKVVIGLLAVLTFVLARDQLLHPRLSVGIFAQLGVYAYFSAAFVPIVFGIFLPHAPRMAAMCASIVAVVVHFGTYFGGITPYLQGAVRNPAVSATYAILSSLTVGLLLYGLRRRRPG